MRKIFTAALIGLGTMVTIIEAHAENWSLQTCINYALQHNIQLQKQNLQTKNAQEDWLQAKAALLPNLNADAGQHLSYQPWIDAGISGEGYAKSSIKKVSYNGSYGVSSSWVLWNGNRNTNNVKLSKLAIEKSNLDAATTANSLQEQITQLYIQILYSTEAIQVNQQNLENSKQNELRGKELVKEGKMSKADLAQLSAQRAQDEYNVVAAQSTTQNYKRQLKQLLQITSEEEFNIEKMDASEQEALADIPTLNQIYDMAVTYRPEIKSYQNMIDQSNLQLKMAKAQGLPTVSFNAGLATSTTTLDQKNWATQLKSNLNVGTGLSVSIPLIDNRARKTAVNKALLMKENSILDLRNQETTLFSTIENYWLQAMTNQNEFKAAKVSSESARISYELLNEQFKLGLKNIVELRTGKDNLLKAQQNELQSKYLTILNLYMLNFYRTGELR